MTLGKAPLHADLYRSTSDFCEERLSATSIYRLLHDSSHRLFPDEAFADLFATRGRRSIPPRVVAVVMVLQRFEGLSDREAVEHIAFDLRWKYAAGDLDYDHGGFVHTVLVDMRARLRGSSRPNRIFDAVLDVAKEAGLVGRRRVLDSTALYDAVATQDTVTMIRSAICGLLRVAEPGLVTELRKAVRRDDDYATPGKPACNWEDAAERDALVDTLARDGHALLACLDDAMLSQDVGEAAKLLATVLGQDLEQRDDGVFRIARRVKEALAEARSDLKKMNDWHAEFGTRARLGWFAQARENFRYNVTRLMMPGTEQAVTTTLTPELLAVLDEESKRAKERTGFGPTRAAIAGKLLVAAIADLDNEHKAIVNTKKRGKKP